MNGFKVYELATTSSLVPVSCRRDFYRVYLFSGPHLLPRVDPAPPLHGGPCLCVGHPYPVGLVPGAGQPPGYACLFTEAFMRENGYFGGLEQWARLHGQAAVVPLRAEQAAHLTLLHNCLQLVMHEALRYRQPVSRCFRFYFRSPMSELRAAWQNRW
jgi:AraC family transcriptional activator of pobA